MSFSNVTASPSWGIEAAAPAVGRGTWTAGTSTAVDALNTKTADLEALFCAAVNTSAMNKPFAGWITYSGGGGSTRPSSGFIYPRGDQ